MGLRSADSRSSSLQGVGVDSRSSSLQELGSEGRNEWGGWLPDMDSNHDKQIQSLLCYRYTIRQAR